MLVKDPRTKNLRFPVVKNFEDLRRVVDRIMKNNQLFALDLETDSLNPWRGSIVGLSIATSEKGAFYVPLKHQHDQPFDGDKALRILKPLLSEYPFIAYNAGFELGFLEEAAGIVHHGEVHDPSLMAYVKGEYRSLSLKDVSESIGVWFEIESFHEFMNRQNLNPNKTSIGVVPTTEVADYCGRDALATFILYKKLRPQVEHNPIYKIEKKLFPVVYQLRKNGVKVDVEYFKSEQERLDLELENIHKSIEAEISAETGEEINFNVASTQQLGEVLYNVLGYPCDNYTKTGRPSVDKKTLNKLKWKYPIVRDIIAYKEISKRANTYYNKYMGFVEKDGRIHANYNQSGVPTGRFSCSSPNLQNIPRKEKWNIKSGKEKREIEINTREGFIAPEGYLLMEFDYSQIEARVAAAVTNERALVGAFQRGEDYHTKTASLVFDVPIDKVTKKQRYLGKKLNFALSYGMGTNALFHELREELDISFNQAKLFRRKYIEAFKLMFDEAAKIAKGGKPHGGVDTIFGRFVPVWDWDKREDADRMAYNAVIQGTAADVLKIKMVRLDQMLKKSYAEDAIKIIMTTHDSLTLEVPKEINLQTFVEEVKKVLKVVLKEKDGFRAEIEVPVNVSIGYRWGRMRELGDFGGNVQALLKSFKGENVKEKKGKTFVLEFPETRAVTMSQEEIIELKEYFKARPGDNRIIIKSGFKESVLPMMTSVDMKDKDNLTLMTGGSFYEYF